MRKLVVKHFIHACFSFLAGKDAASARYIFIELSSITRRKFNENDDILLDYLCEDGQSIEPSW